jgi:phage/plasmid primase-like uncharacterized protein
MIPPNDDFRDAIRAAGLEPPEHIEPGKFHRFPGADKRNGNTAGWGLLFEDGEGGVFGDWSTDTHEVWQAKRKSAFTKEERAKFKRQLAKARDKTRREREAARQAAAKRAVEIWDAAEPGPADHPYLRAKGIQPHGARVHKCALVIPIRDGGELCSLQFIDAAGDKRFLHDGRTAGCYFAIGKPDGTVYICEGFSTGASIHEATGQAVAVAFNAGNLDLVAKALKETFANTDIIIAGDNDESGIGRDKAEAAALAVSGFVAIPPVTGTDWNDYANERGPDAVREKIEGHYIPPRNRATAQPSPASARSDPPKMASELDILAAFRRDVQLRGLVGEAATAQLLYLAITSRLLDKPVSIGVKGHSSSGKSHTVDRVIEFFPENALIKFTGMSERALIYREDDYKHRTLVIYEVTGLREGNEDDLASYFVRSLLSEGRLEYDVTVRGKDGQYTTQRIIKEGPTNLIFTTTKTRVHAENETRVLSLNTDDGTDQTRNVLSALADEADRDVDLNCWRRLQEWLQTAEHKVTIPYAATLAEAVPPLAVRLRRDFGAVLALIRSHAILHQQTRDRDERGRIVATIDDYAVVRELVAGVISEGIGATVSDSVRETVEAVKTVSKDDQGVMVSEIARHLKIDKSNASRRVRRAADGGYIRNLEDKRGRPGRWVAGDPLPETVEVLPQPATVRTAETRATPSDCAVAPMQEGIQRPAPEPAQEAEKRAASIPPATGTDGAYQEEF